MYPPVEAASGATSAPVYFEPLPDVAAKAAQLRQQQQQQANATPTAARLRPKISAVNRDQADSGGDCGVDDVEVSQWCDAAYEQVKLERLLGWFLPFLIYLLHAISEDIRLLTLFFQMFIFT